MAIRHLKMAVEWKGEILGVLETRRHYGNYFKGIANFKDTKSRILNEKNPATIIKELETVKKNFSEAVLYQALVLDLEDQAEVTTPITTIVVKTIITLEAVKDTGYGIEVPGT